MPYKTYLIKDTNLILANSYLFLFLRIFQILECKKSNLDNKPQVF